MITRGTTDATSAPNSPSSRAHAALTVNAISLDNAVVVGVTRGEDPWTATSSLRTSDPPPLRVRKRSTGKAAPVVGGDEAHKGKKKLVKRSSEEVTNDTQCKNH
ncbi:hypothetical protein PHYBOEH_000829 [Phytophthora boehmeriae]|uniref:Kinesin motor domain-containing protein n=1 Tax=Phytophthora boehmeriae TaxID=109152 RepID=A0A8T1X032_9STRA|nr:hypothetical protein PHYBOEH_000829 [Phytophthora boehmeriae]